MGWCPGLGCLAFPEEFFFERFEIIILGKSETSWWLFWVVWSGVLSSLWKTVFLPPWGGGEIGARRRPK